MEKGLGFISMKERLHLLGGQMSVYSRPMRGTRIEDTVPLKLDPQSPTDHASPTNVDERLLLK
jgi:signal transduction histidine kinase